MAIRQPTTDPRFLKARQALEKAVSFQRQGLLAEAENVYARLIKQNPDYFDALHFFGLFKYEQGKLQDAHRLLERATKINSRSANAFNSRGVVLGALHRDAEAIGMFDSALALEPNHVPSLSNRGNSLNALGRFQEAINTCERALAINPTYLDAYIPRGAALLECRRYLEAFANYERAITLNPGQADGWLGRGNSLLKLKRYDEALVAYDRALALKPNSADGWLSRGNLFLWLKRYDEALADYDRALALQPGLATASLNRGNLFRELKRYDEAFAAYDRVLSLEPNQSRAWLGRANSFADLNRYDEALAAYDRALALKSDFAEAWVGRGNLFWQLHRHDEAFAAYERALALNSNLAEAWLGLGNLFLKLKRHDESFAAYDRALAENYDLPEVWLGRGDVLTELKRYDDAFAAYDHAISLRSDMADAYWNKALAKLTVGSFKEGWDLYEWRAQHKDNILFHPRLSLYNTSVRQNRSALRGKQIAILSEQGVGDEIMFASILPDLIGDARSIFYEVDQRLIPLFEGAFPTVKFVPKGGHDFLRQHVFDVVLQAGSLGYTYRRDYESFPRVPYLSAEPIRINKWKELLASEASSHKTIGISWRGGTDGTRRHDRSIDLECLSPLIRRDNCYFVSLQYGNVNDEILKFNKTANNAVHSLLDDFNNFDDFAALISALDLVISVQNTTIHMCGALGKSCWGLIPWRPEWRYGSHGESMVWYKSVSLHRQAVPGDWSDVMSMLASNLENFLGHK